MTQESILDAATRVFRERGYRAATLESVANALGVTRAALYYHFKSKEDILVEMIRRRVGEVLMLAESLMAEPLPAPVKYRRLLMHHIQRVAEHADALCIFYEEFRRIRSESLDNLQRMRREYTRRLEELYQQGVREGSFVEVDPALAVRTHFGAANWVYQWAPNARCDPKTMAENMTDLLMTGYLKGCTMGGMGECPSISP